MEIKDIEIVYANGDVNADNVTHYTDKDGCLILKFDQDAIMASPTIAYEYDGDFIYESDVTEVLYKHCSQEILDAMDARIKREGLQTIDQYTESCDVDAMREYADKLLKGYHAYDRRGDFANTGTIILTKRQNPDEKEVNKDLVIDALLAQAELNSTQSWYERKHGCKSLISVKVED